MKCLCNMKNKLIPWLQYCLECGGKNKRIKNIFVKEIRQEYNIKAYRCLKCKNSKITYSKTTLLNNSYYKDSLNILTSTFGGFRYIANKNNKWNINSCIEFKR